MRSKKFSYSRSQSQDERRPRKGPYLTYVSLINPSIGVLNPKFPQGLMKHSEMHEKGTSSVKSGNHNVLKRVMRVRYLLNFASTKPVFNVYEEKEISRLFASRPPRMKS